MISKMCFFNVTSQRILNNSNMLSRNDCWRDWWMLLRNGHVAVLRRPVRGWVGPIFLCQEHRKGIPHVGWQHHRHLCRSFTCHRRLAHHQEIHDSRGSRGWVGKDQGYWQPSLTVGSGLQGGQKSRLLYTTGSHWNYPPLFRASWTWKKVTSFTTDLLWTSSSRSSALPSTQPT